MADWKLRVLGHAKGGVPWTWAWNISSTLTESALQTAWATAITDFWTNGTYGVDTLYATTTVLDDIEIIGLDATFKWTSRFSQSLTLAGTSSDNPLPNDVSLLLRLESPGLYPNQRGRTKLPAPVEGIYDGQQFTAAGAGRAGTAARALRFAMVSGGDTIFVHTGATVTKHGVAPYTKTVITNVQASGKPASARQRARKTASVYY